MQGGAEMMRRSRYVVECYSLPEQFETKEEFLKALTEALDELCVAHGREVPQIEGVFDR